MGYQIYGHNPLHLKDPNLPLPSDDTAWFADTEEAFVWHQASAVHGELDAIACLRFY